MTFDGLPTPRFSCVIVHGVTMNRVKPPAKKKRAKPEPKTAPAPKPPKEPRKPRQFATAINGVISGKTFEWEAIDAAAAEAGITRSEFVKRAALTFTPERNTKLTTESKCLCATREEWKLIDSRAVAAGMTRSQFLMRSAMLAIERGRGASAAKSISPESTSASTPTRSATTTKTHSDREP